MTDKFAWALIALFVIGLIGGAVHSVNWLWLCAPFLIAVAVIALCFWLANRQLKGWNLWQ